MRLLFHISAVLFFGLLEGVLGGELGGNLLANPGFETSGTGGLPADWAVSQTPEGCAQIALDGTNALEGRRSLMLSIPESGSVQVHSKPVPVQGGGQYLFTIAFRSEGFGPKGYAGVEASASFQWLDAQGKQVSQTGGVGFPYTPSPWDLRDTFTRAPATAVQVVVCIGFGNASKSVAKQVIPSKLWLDACQLRPYTPPPTPDWAQRPVAMQVEGGWENTPVKCYHLAALQHAGGKWGAIVADPQSTFGTAVSSPPDIGSGLMCHSIYFPSAAPGLYRLILRCKVADTRRAEPAGTLDIGSEHAHMRGLMTLEPRQFAAPDTYQEFSMDFILRTPGYWMFRVATAGNQPFTVDTVKIFPLQLFADRQLLDIYPGSDGVVPADVQPVKGGPVTTLVIAGLGYDRWRIADAAHLLGYRATITPVWVQKERNQSFHDFPETFADLARQRLVILCDTDATCLTLRQKRMLLEYVRRGGGAIFLGGHKAFERGGLAGSLLDEMLPIAVASGSGSLLHAPGGLPLEKAQPHPLTAFLDLAAGPAVQWMHEVQARPGSETILTAGGNPAVVLGHFGKGRVVCCALTCFGVDGPGRAPFWQWPAWAPFLRDLCWWTAGDDAHFLPDKF